MSLKKQLDVPYPINVEITKIGVNSIAIDPTNQQAHIGYSTVQADDIVFQKNKPETLTGTDYTDFLARTDELGETLEGTVAQKQAALEYAPGVGSISGEFKILNTPYTIDGTVMGLDVDSFAFNEDGRLVHIGYSEMDTISSNLVTNRPYTLSGVEYEEFMARFNVLNQTYTTNQAEIATCLEFLPGEGTVVNV